MDFRGFNEPWQSRNGAGSTGNNTSRLAILLSPGMGHLLKNHLLITFMILYWVESAKQTGMGRLVSLLATPTSRHLSKSFDDRIV